MNIKPYKVYLFDFDGTLFDTIKSSEYVFKEAYASIGVTIKDEDILGYTREPIPDAYKRLNAPEDKWDIFADNIVKLVNSDKSCELTYIYYDTYNTVIDLKTDEAILGIVTSNNVKHVKDILKKYNMEDIFFDVLVGNEEAPTPKPDPMPILVALKMLNYKGDLKDVVYVGDALNDIKAAKAAHIESILLDRDNHYPDSDEYIKIHSLNELL